MLSFNRPPQDFKQSFQQLERRVAILQRNLRTTTHDSTRHVRNEELNALQKEFRILCRN